IICNEIPLIFHKEIYATACIAGSVVYIVLHQLNTTPNLDVTLAVMTVLLIRLAAIRWHLALPRFHLLDRD
ncbi:MAG: trimeric intracellular cation channel family protein, partial [Pseudomonas sp.]